MKRILLVVTVLMTGVFAGRMLCGQSQLKQINDELVQIARKLSPTVVEIEFEGVRAPQAFRQEGGDERGQWRAEVRVMGDAGEGGTLRGSGIVMTPDGLILTASDHLRGQGEPKMKVTLADGRSFPGKLVGRDNRTGLAAVKIDAQGLSAVTVAEKSPPVGSLVVALGDTAGVGRSLSLGIVAGTQRVVGGEGPGILGSSTQYAGLLQITNPVSASDVGGLVADVDGKMVGMLQSSLTGRPRLARLLEQPGAPGGVQVFGLGAFGPPTVQGVSFATPVEVIRRVFDTLQRGEKVQWGYLGVYFTIARNEGLRVSKLMPDGPAAAAGVKEGDVIRSLATAGQETLKLKGEPEEVAVFAKAIGWTTPGTEVTLGLMRDGREESLKVKLGSAPEMPEQDVMILGPELKFRMDDQMNPMRGRVWLGVQLEQAQGGGRVAAVIPGSPAERHGLHVGDIITRIADKDTGTPEAVVQEIEKHKPGERIPIAFKRGEEEVVADVELGRQPGAGAAPFAFPAPGQMGIEAGNTENGLRITRVIEGSPAEKAGLKKDDIIVRADDKDIAGLNDLREIVRKHKANDEITVTVRRGAQEMEVKVKLGAAGQGPEPPMWMP